MLHNLWVRYSKNETGIYLLRVPQQFTRGERCWWWADKYLGKAIFLVQMFHSNRKEEGKD